MGNIYIFLIYLLVLLCGGCAVTEMIIGNGTGWGLLSVFAGLVIIVYIVRIPVEEEK